MPRDAVTRVFEEGDFPFREGGEAAFDSSPAVHAAFHGVEGGAPYLYYGGEKTMGFFVGFTVYTDVHAGGPFDVLVA
jgi:hypothetical protein